MIKQEEIREGIAKDLAVIDTRDRPEYAHYTREDIWQAVLNEGTEDLYLEDARLIMVGLNAEGVVIKVDRELSESSLQKDCWNCAYKELNPCPYKPRGFNHCKNFKNFKVGYVAVAPLI